MTRKCPVCSCGTMSERVVTEDFSYKRKKLIVADYHLFKCSDCGEEVVAEETVRKTEKVLTDFRRGVDGLLLSSDIKRIRKKMGKTQVEMAKLLGVGEKNFARYESGQVTQSRAMDLLLRGLDACPSLLQMIAVGRKEVVAYESVERLSQRIVLVEPKEKYKATFSAEVSHAA